MLRFRSVLGAQLIQASQPVALGLATGSALVSIIPAPAQAQGAEAVARVAAAITV